MKRDIRIIAAIRVQETWERTCQPASPIAASIPRIIDEPAAPSQAKLKMLGGFRAPDQWLRSTRPPWSSRASLCPSRCAARLVFLRESLGFLSIPHRHPTPAWAGARIFKFLALSRCCRFRAGIAPPRLLLGSTSQNAVRRIARFALRYLQRSAGPWAPRAASCGPPAALDRARRRHPRHLRYLEPSRLSSCRPCWPSACSGTSQVVDFTPTCGIAEDSRSRLHGSVSI